MGGVLKSVVGGGVGIEKKGEVGGGTQFMHGCSRYDHRSSHPYYAGTEHVGFSPIRNTLFAPSAKRRECSASRMKGELHSSYNRS